MPPGSDQCALAAREAAAVTARCATIALSVSKTNSSVRTSTTRRAGSSNKVVTHLLRQQPCGSLIQYRLSRIPSMLCTENHHLGCQLRIMHTHGACILQWAARANECMPITPQMPHSAFRSARIVCQTHSIAPYVDRYLLWVRPRKQAPPFKLKQSPLATVASVD